MPAVGAEFVGTAACIDCHEQQHEAWRGSHHDLAMQQATADSVLGDFADAAFTYGKVKSTFYRRDDGFFVRTDNADGKLADFQVRYTFGVSPLQQYLIEFPDGRLQALGIAWDTRPAAQGGQRWFHLYPDEQIGHDDELHWTSPQQNWNFQCADCHSTDVQKHYDPVADRFATTWTDINVGCEACHGPGADHVAWSGQEPTRRTTDPRKGWAFSLPRWQDTAWPIDPETGSPAPKSEPAMGGEIEVCADCHARRGSLAGSSESDPRFLNHYMPALLTEGLYYADGQIQDEVFVWGSFTQSRMHQAGVTCSNCHDPHSQRLRAPGDAVCAQCHQPAKFASPAHHHHPLDSAGASCVDCHMPETTYMVVDPRRDHSIRIPRPDLSVTLGTPNACNRCHSDRDARWAAGHTARWYPNGRQGQQTWAEAFAAARAGNPAAEMQLVALLQDRGTPDIARATALWELREFLSPASGDALQQAMSDSNPLVRISGLRALEILPAEQRYPFASKLLDDPLLAVRVEAGRVLAAVPEASLSVGQRTQLRRAVAEYVRSQEYHADRADARTNLGNLFLQRGDMARAEREFRRAIELDPGFVPAYANLSDLYRVRRMDDAAAKVLAEAISRQPEAAALHHAMGLLQIRGGDPEAAVQSLGEAARLSSRDARYAYVYAIALNSIGDPGRSLTVLEHALAMHPFDRDILLALVTINRDQGNPEAARGYARRMLEIRPDDQQARQLGESLR
jgi:predicted CXXCH cytochrome family protein